MSLLFDYVGHTRRNVALGLYDTASFYDCIAHNFASLADKAVGTV